MCLCPCVRVSDCDPGGVLCVCGHVSVCQTVILVVSCYRVGSSASHVSQDIQLNGSYILEQHCHFENKNGQSHISPLLWTHVLGCHVSQCI